jgi:hypothetical protein
MTTKETPSQENRQQSWVAALALLRPQIAYGLLALAVLLAGFSVWMAVKYHWDAAPAIFWGGSIAVVALGAGLWFLLDESPDLAGLESGRALVLIVGGLSGFATWLVSVWLVVKWRATLLGGLEAWQGENRWQLWVCLLAMFGALALMFFSLLPARVAVRTSAGLRRLIFGYNSVLTGLLLLAILLVLNVLIYSYFPAASDWTEESIYSLSDQSKNVLKSLDKPTKVYALFPRGTLEARELDTLLENCRVVNDKFDYEFVSPDLNIARLRELKSQYQVGDREGVLVVYGPEQQPSYQFIKYTDLFANDPNPDPTSKKSRFYFKGEDALVSTLSFLEQGKTKSVIYFTQGNGELDLKDSSASQPGQGAGTLKDRLQKANYDVKGLQISALPGKKSKDDTVISDKVPDDAEVVVVAGPTRQLPDYALKALRDYMNPTGDKAKKGKLVVLLDTPLDINHKLVHTGLESLLSEYNVEVGDNRVLALPNNITGNDPTNVLVFTDPRGTNPVAEAFRGKGFVMPRLRTVKPRPSPGPGGGSVYTADSLLFTIPDLDCWTETNFNADPTETIARLRKDEAFRKQFAEKTLAQEPLSVAVTVTEPAAPRTGDPHEFMRQQADQKPRLVVFGSSAFASNRYMTEGSGSASFPLLNSTLSWLRERPSNIGIEPKKRNVFVLNVSDDTLLRMQFLPTLVVLLGIVCVGSGVWLVRRR